MIDSTENATPLKSAKSRNSNSSVRILMARTTRSRGPRTPVFPLFPGPRVCSARFSRCLQSMLESAEDAAKCVDPPIFRKLMFFGVLQRFLRAWKRLANKQNFGRLKPMGSETKEKWRPGRKLRVARGSVGAEAPPPPRAQPKSHFESVYREIPRNPSFQILWNSEE